jgi:hypothetical protein
VAAHEGKISSKNDSKTREISSGFLCSDWGVYPVHEFVPSFGVWFLVISDIMSDNSGRIAADLALSNSRKVMKITGDLRAGVSSVIIRIAVLWNLILIGLPQLSWFKSLLYHLSQL